MEYSEDGCYNKQNQIDGFITVQSLASSFMLKTGCYKDVYQVSGAIQQFMSKGVVGGRVITNSNKQYHVKRKLLTLVLVVYTQVLCIIWSDF